jgi:hypothetical protein
MSTQIFCVLLTLENYTLRVAYVYPEIDTPLGPLSNSIEVMLLRLKQSAIIINIENLTKSIILLYY